MIFQFSRCLSSAIFEFLNLEILLVDRVRRAEEHHYANFVKIGQSVEEIWWFFNFSRWQPSAILDLFGAYFDHPLRALGGLYHYAKFGTCDQCSSFNNMKV